jgi:hypothetical protein
MVVRRAQWTLLGIVHLGIVAALVEERAAHQKRDAPRAMQIAKRSGEGVVEVTDSRDEHLTIDSATLLPFFLTKPSPAAGLPARSPLAFGWSAERHRQRDARPENRPAKQQV